MSLKNYGLVIKESEPEAYVLGGLTSLPKTILNVRGNWSNYLPTYEPQYNEQYDSYGCTVWGTENIVETLLKFIDGKEHNFSERFIYILAGIKPPGADPHYVSEVIRHKGLIKNELLPMTPSYSEFLTPNPMTAKYLVEGQRFGYEVKHEYVFTGNTPKEERIEKIRECLKYSPLGVSVTAWIKGPDGIYIDDGQPNTHWCMLFGENSKGFMIFDSYDQSIKTISFDHYIQICKRYVLVKKELKKNWFVDIIEKLLAFIKDILR